MENIWYELKFGEVQPVKVLKETDAFVTVERKWKGWDGADVIRQDRCKKDGSFGRFFKTKREAYAYVVSKHEQRLAAIEQEAAHLALELTKARNHLAECEEA